MSTSLTKYKSRSNRPASVAINHTAVTAAIAGYLRHRRTYDCLTQIEMARRLGVSFQQIQKYERGENALTVSRLVQYCEALGISPLDIVAKAMNAEAMDLAA